MGRFVAVGAVVFMSLGCSEASSSDGVEQNQGAQSADSSDLLATCPAIEGVTFETTLGGDAVVKQTYDFPGYRNDDGTLVPANRVLDAAPASSIYTVRFYRDMSGKTKFAFAIGTLAGNWGSIEGSAKRLAGSGTVSYRAGETSGALVFTSRRENLERVVGRVESFRFSNFDCSGQSQQLTVDAPVVTLDKVNDETVQFIDSSGTARVVDKSVRWVKRASTTSLSLTVLAGD